MIRLLFSSDWQVQFSNLQECDIVLDELIAAADKYKPDAIIHAGDVKDAYSPVDVMVVKFCVRMVRRIRAAGHRLIILKGNHDRVSQSPEAKDWLDVLGAAGAEVVSSPRVKMIGETAVAFLPYIAAEDELVAASKTLLEQTCEHPGAKILVFHAEIAGCVLNAGGGIGRGPTDKDLGFEHYTACFGGHIHDHQACGQSQGHAWYIGSPFCQSWSEANSRKGNLLATIKKNIPPDMERRGYKGEWTVKVKQIETAIPHWYDIEYLEGWGIEPEPGAYIRAKVKVTSKKITDRLREEEERIRAKYGDVRIHVVPVIEDEGGDEVKLSSASTDSEKIERYVAATLPEAARFEAAQAVAYMASKTRTWTDIQSGGALRFINAEAENVLVFEKPIRVPLANQGIVLVRGIDEDTGNRSNGSGKTSLLSLLPIGAFGEPGTKKQKSDAWAFERNDNPAWVKLRFHDAVGNRIRVERGRRPHFIRLYRNKEDVSTGITGLRKNETQGLIEEVMGYDLRTLMNAVYIDQAVANSFVFGSESKRMDLIGTFQNLERFEEARKAVASDIKRCDDAMLETRSAIELYTAEADHAQAELEAVASVENVWGKRFEGEQRKLAGLIEEHAAVAATSGMYEELQRALDDLVVEHRAAAKLLKVAEGNLSIADARLITAKQLIAAKKCPTCSQPSEAIGKKTKTAAQEAILEAEKVLVGCDQTEKQLQAKIYETTGRIDRYHETLRRLENAIAQSRERIGELESAAEEEAARSAKAKAARAVAHRAFALASRFKKAAVASSKTLGVDREMLEYAHKAFHRTGIPLYLSVALCPILNKAAAEYSEIFTDGQLQITFAIEDGEFAVGVVNPAGSKTVAGQSVGEAAMAGIICAFALREVAPKTNILVMDEPGSGLDPEGCKQFARGILRLKDRFESIFVVTHSPYIESVLSGEQVWTVQKKRGRSRLLL